MRSAATFVRGTFTFAACFSLSLFLCLFAAPPCLHADTFEVDGKPVEGEIIDLVKEGVFIVHGEEGHTVLWKDLTTFQAKDIRILHATELRNLRTGAIWISGSVREVFAEGAVVYADGRPRANYGAEFNDPSLDPEKPRPRGSRKGSPAGSNWYLVTDLPDAEDLINQTVQMIAYPNGNVEELQLAEENDPEKIPAVTLALPEWAGVRDWTNQQGQTIQAELIYVEGGNCIFERDGQTITYPAENLSEADRKLVQICEDMAKAVFIDPSVRQ